MNDQQRTEAFEKLEDGTRVTQHAVPGTESDRLDEATLSKDVFVPGSSGLGSLKDAAEGSLDPARAPSVDGELAEGPDEQRGDDDPLRHAQEGADGPSQARLVGQGDADARVEEVVDEEAQAVGEAGVATTDIEGDGDGEDDGKEEDGAKEDAESPQHGCGRVPSAWPSWEVGRQLYE